MKCQGMICTWEKLSEAPELRLVLGKLQGSLLQIPWHRDAGGCSSPHSAPPLGINFAGSATHLAVARACPCQKFGKATPVEIAT